MKWISVESFLTQETVVFLSKIIPISRGCCSRIGQFLLKESNCPRELGFKTSVDFFSRKWVEFLNLEVMRDEEK